MTGIIEVGDNVAVLIYTFMVLGFLALAFWMVER